MKFLKYFFILLISFMAMSCSDESVTPRDGGDEDDDPIIENPAPGGGTTNP